MAPAPVAHLGELWSGADQVGEQRGCEHTIVIDASIWLREEPLDLCQHRTCIAQEHVEFRTRDLDEAGIGNQVAAARLVSMSQYWLSRRCKTNVGTRTLPNNGLDSRLRLPPPSSGRSCQGSSPRRARPHHRCKTGSWATRGLSDRNPHGRGQDASQLLRCSVE